MAFGAALLALAALLPPAAAVAGSTAADSSVAGKPSAAFTSVEFEGAHALQQGDLRRALGLPLAADSLNAGLRRLDQMYYDLGYVEATFTPARETKNALRVRIEEGRRARLAAVYLRGAQAVSQAEVRALLGLRQGDVFRAPEVEARLRLVLDEYARRGFLAAEAVIERLELGSDGVTLGVALSEGPSATLTEVSVQGNTISQAQLVQRLARLGTPQPANGRRILEAPQLLRRSGLFAAVDEPVLYRRESAEHVGVLLRVEEAKQRNTIYGAVGVARDPVRDRAYLSGAIDLALRNIYGTGRDLTVDWSRDARSSSRLALGYRERFLMGLPLDLALDLAQTERDSTYTYQSLNTSATLPVNRTLSLELGGGLDRSVYHSLGSFGLRGNAVRLRGLVGMRFESLLREVDGRRFGTLEVRVESARKHNDLQSGDASDRSHVRQTLWSGRFDAGAPLGPRHVLAARGEWHALTSNEAEVPASELYYFGGARTLRGYREDQFRGEQVAYGGVEYRVGDPRGGRLYAFVDAGALRLHRDGGLEQSVHVGYGLGLRAEVPSGIFDLSFALGEERSFSAVKVHVSLVQRF